MSLDDVYNIQVEAMNKVTKEDWISGPLASGKVKEVSLWRTVGFDTKKGTMTTTLCVVKNTQWLIHMFPCVEWSDNYT